MITLIFRIITHAVQFATILTCIWYLYKKKAVEPYRLFAIGWSLVLSYDLTMVVIGLISPVKNHWVYNIAFPLIQIFSIWIFILLIQQRKLSVLIALFLLFAVYNFLMIQGKTTLNTYSLAAGGIIVLLLASIQMLRIYREETSQSLFEQPDFWLCTGFIVYWALATPFYAMYNFLWANYPDFFILYFRTVSIGFTIVLNLCIIKALQCSLNTVKR